jgi:putative ABC transport system permease protein
LVAARPGGPTGQPAARSAVLGKPVQPEERLIGHRAAARAGTFATWRRSDDPGGLTTSAHTIAGLGSRAQPTSFYFQLAPGVDPRATAKRLEGAFLASGMQAQSTRDALKEIVGGSRTMNNIILGFLGLGLIIGVAALGVVSARSIVERRQQIGVLRAIGFQRRMVQFSFLLESSVIAGGAIVLGTTLGIVMANNVINDSASQPSWSRLALQLPWTTFLLVFGIVYAAALVATFLPARRASQTAPASALRYQ